MSFKGPFDDIPDVRDGLTRLERVILYELQRAKAEFGERYVPTALLYGRVVEHINVGKDEFQRALSRLAGR
jgi:DNA gyrase/topoisomerase IV subunit A